MAELNAELVEHKLNSQQREIESLKTELRDFKKEVEDDLEESNKKITKLATSQGRIEIMFSNLSEKMEEIGLSVNRVAEAAGKDQGWRALITDIVKVILLILGFFATGKFFF
ncbi:hypothetical protein [Terribacillus saccharophilus]|uniref:hypothetical protein n=1 Tax=Terribacillus saccharophilus TaxID=361277 RepID=UPI000BA56400|nr:hypothetical protein [Terribacillus saccharophilus]PAF19764.1 hypothetical protein CHH51_01495 [Terribacillus saccharophilus]